MADDKLIIPVGFNFNIEEIDKEWQAKKAEIEKALKAEISLTFKMPSTKSLDNLESVVNRLKDLKIEPITPETKDAISSLTRELTTLQKILERIQALNIKSAKDVAATALAEEKITTQRAIAAKNLAQQRSNNALAVTRENKALLQQKTLEDQAALVKLRVQKAEESLTNARNRSLGAIKSQNSALATQKGILNGMPQFLNQYLSILGAWRLVDNIRKTTADFELQRISLQAMIQDKEKADKLFGQTLELAIESPFTAQELISYTKQLSAYRIETDKLFDTTKRLADVSAGLGVDMSRLILAYGQVRAASVLRGQEVRQFTESEESKGQLPCGWVVNSHLSDLRGGKPIGSSNQPKFFGSKQTIVAGLNQLRRGFLLIGQDGLGSCRFCSVYGAPIGHGRYFTCGPYSNEVGAYG